VGTTIVEAAKVLLSDSSDALRAALLTAIHHKFVTIAHWKRIPEQDIDDVVNDGIEKLLGTLRQFRGEGPFDHWATVLFSNVCVDYFRRQARRKILESLRIGNADFRGESDPPSVDTFADIAPDPPAGADSRRMLRRVMSILDNVIEETANRRKQKERDTEIARLGLQALLEPREIAERLAERFPNLTVNAIRIVLHEFRASLRDAVEKQPGDEQSAKS
jgi:RNA polymerase sigma factor (sigma-70 family)